MRYMQGMKLDARTAHERLLRICFPDYDREIALVAEHQAAGSGERTVVAVGRLSRDRIARSGGGVLVAGRRSLARARRGHARSCRASSRSPRREGIARIYADILEANMRMQRLCARLGFTIGEADGGVVRADREI